MSNYPHRSSANIRQSSISDLAHFTRESKNLRIGDRIDYGQGYRVYFAQGGVIIILLLCGGDKTTQDRDIIKAKQYWKDFQNRQNANS